MEITEENYKQYRKYVDAILGTRFYSQKESSFYLKMCISATLAFGVPTLSMAVGHFFSIILSVIMTAGVSVLAFSREIMRARTQKLMKKDCPDFDEKIDFNELCKELTKFEEKSNNPRALEERGSESIRRLETLAGKDSKEILRILEEEKAFWERCVEAKKEEEIVKSKKMC